MTAPTTSTPPVPARVEFGPAIRQAAATAGRAPTAEQVAELDDDFNGRFFIDYETGAVSVATAAGPVLDAQAAIRAAVAGWPLAAPPVLDTLRPNSGAARRAAEAARAAAEVRTWPNPWKDGQVNRTRQVVMRKVDPARAEKFMKESGR